jgi:hypothetical protein
MDKRVYTFEDVSVHSESQKAYHCEIGTMMFWVPKSQIKTFEIDEGLLTTTTWWAEISGAQEAYERWCRVQEEIEAARARQREQERQARQQQAPSPVEINLNKAISVYRKLALKYHPDKNPDSAEVMRDLNELWQEVLAAAKKNGKG